eukprot:11811722-Karenia_brevis.AAC.1
MVSDKEEMKAWDDVNGSELPLEGVTEGRRGEIDDMEGRDLWTRVPGSECWEVTGEAPISVRR